MAIKYLSGNRVTALSTDLVSETTTEIGYTGSSQAHINSIHYKRFSATAGQKITKIGVRVYSCSDTKFKGGVYTDNGASDGSGQTGTARPQTLLSQGEITGVSTSGANLWVEVDVDCTVPSNGLFWVGFISDDNSTNWYRDLSNTLASGGVYGSDCTPSGRWSNYANMMYSTANYGNGNNNQVSGNNVNMRYTISTPKLGTTDATTSIDDDFSSDNFTNVGSQSGWGVSSNSMAWTTYRNSTVQGEYIALPSTFSGNFVVRFKLTPTTVAYAGTEEYLWVGLTNSNSCNSATSQNQAGFYFHNYSSSDSKYQVTYITNSGLFSGASATSINFSSTAYWVEIIKDGDSVKLTLYSDEYVTAVSGGTATSTAGGATDSYTHFVLTGMYHGSSSGGGSSLGTIDDLKIYKDITSAASTDNAVTVPNGSVAEETDTGKHQIWNATTSAWVEVG